MRSHAMLSWALAMSLAAVACGDGGPSTVSLEGSWVVADVEGAPSQVDSSNGSWLFEAGGTYDWCFTYPSLYDLHDTGSWSLEGKQLDLDGRLGTLLQSPIELEILHADSFRARDNAGARWTYVRDENAPECPGYTCWNVGCGDCSTSCSDAEVGICFEGQCLCADGPPGCGCRRQYPDATHRQFALDSVRLPTSVDDAQALGFDLDADPAAGVDNALGRLLAYLGSGATLQARMDAAVDQGEVIHLIDVDEPNTETKLLLGFDCSMWFGADTLAIATDSPDSSLPSSLDGESLMAGPGRSTVDLVLVTGDSMRAALIGARLSATVGPSELSDGILGGAIAAADVDTVLVPAVVASIQETLESDCPGSVPACCTPDSEGARLVALFDSDDDCRVSATELIADSMVATLLEPDVDLLDGEGNYAPRVDGVLDSFSIGLGFTAAPSAFELP